MKSLILKALAFIFNGKVMDEVRSSFEGILVVGHLIFLLTLVFDINLIIRKYD